jgi:putative inorganic carbon (HCO3(-)) transporter
MPLRVIVLVLFFVISVPICFIRPFYGVLLWIVVAFLNPQSFTWSSFEAFPWAAAVAVPTMLGMVAFDHNFGRLRSRHFLLMVALWIWFTITTVVSTNTPEFVHHAVETWQRWNLVSKMLLMSACAIPIVSSFERLRYLVLTIAGCFGLYVLKSLPFIIVTGGAFRLYGPEHSMIADNNDFGLALNMTLPFYFCLAQTESKRWLKLVFVFMFIITIPAIFFTYSRGALVGLTAVFLLMLLQSRRRLALVPVLAIGIAVAIFFAPDAWKQRMDLSRPDAVDASALSRLNSWAYARALAAAYPIAGGGFATFTPELYDRYAPEKSEIAYGPHSVYFQVLAEHGYVGLFLYLSLVISCLAATWRLRRRARRQGDMQIALYAQMFQLSMAAFLVSGLFLGRAYFDYFFTIVACVVALEQLARDRSISSSSVSTDPSARVSTRFDGEVVHR